LPCRRIILDAFSPGRVGRYQSVNIIFVEEKLNTIIR